MLITQSVCIVHTGSVAVHHEDCPMIGILVAIQAHLVATVVVHKLSVVCELGMF